jgi:hypothetical protein
LNPHGLCGRWGFFCSPANRNVPQSGDELAVARALSELSHLLLDVAARDIEQTSGVPPPPVL